MNNHFKHGIGRYLLQLVDKYLENETPGFEFQRPKKVTNLLDTFVLGTIFKVIEIEGEPCSVPPVWNILPGDAPADEHTGGDRSSILLKCKAILRSTKCALDLRGKRSS